MRKIAKFLGKDYTDEEFNRLCEHLTFNNMKKNAHIHHDKWLNTENNVVLRKGTCGEHNSLLSLYQSIDRVKKRGLQF